MFIIINTSDTKRGYYTNYQVSKIQIFISDFKDKKNKELEVRNKRKDNTIKENENKIK